MTSEGEFAAQLHSQATKKLNILMAVMPFSGHVTHMRALTAELLKAGHEVKVYVGNSFKDRFEELGATILNWSEAKDFDENNLSEAFPATGKPGPLGVMANVRDIFIGTAPGQAADLVAEINSNHYDVLVAEMMALGARFAAELTGIKLATISVAPLSLMQPNLPPPVLGFEPGRSGVGKIRDFVLRKMIQLGSVPLELSLKRARMEAGLPRKSVPLDQAWYSEHLTLLTGSATLEFGQHQLPKQYKFVGRLMPPGKTITDSKPQLKNGRPLVLVTQGTFNTDPKDLLLPTLRALAKQEIEVIATTGQRGITSLGEQIPDNARVVDYVDFDEVLPSCSLMITNGGWGGVLTALSHGVPLVVAGSDLDKPSVAARVSAAGAGINLKTGQPSEAAIREAVKKILHSASYTKAAQRLQEEFYKAGGARAAVTHIEQLVHQAPGL